MQIEIATLTPDLQKLSSENGCNVSIYGSSIPNGNSNEDAVAAFCGNCNFAIKNRFEETDDFDMVALSGIKELLATCNERKIINARQKTYRSNAFDADS